MENNAVVLRNQENNALQEHQSSEEKLQQLIEHRTMIKKAMKAEMIDGKHYGSIEGCGDQKVLLQPGAHMLSSLFHFSVKHEIKINYLEGDHREYDATTYIHNLSGVLLGTGVGVCSTKESKYRYNWENTGSQVPKEYWDTRDNKLLGGSQFTPRKKDKKWFIFEKVERDDIADQYNTVKKMAKKRSFVDAVLAVTGATDIFTQDIEDMPDFNIKDAKKKTDDIDYESKLKEIVFLQMENVNELLAEELKFKHFNHFWNAFVKELKPKFTQKYVNDFETSIARFPKFMAEKYIASHPIEPEIIEEELFPEDKPHFERIVSVIDAYLSTFNQRLKPEIKLTTETIIGLIGKENLESMPYPETESDLEEFLNIITKEIKTKMK